jgi:hypothetical protein
MSYLSEKCVTAAISKSRLFLFEHISSLKKFDVHRAGYKVHRAYRTIAFGDTHTYDIFETT